ncbi:MAG: TRAP transporter large permease subunit [Synergistales bacterium]|nr:TRAP transporter large permease subunit [Synergistales bacterium]
MSIGVLTILAFLVLLMTGAHIFIIFFAVGLGATAVLMGFDTAVAMIGQTIYHGIATPTYTVLPLFILMGSFAARAGFAKDAYDTIQIWSRKVPGSLGVATCWASAVFGAVSGSSLASAAVFGKLALPEMRALKYDKAFSLGCIASAGTFASLIPPSGVLIVLAIITDQSVGLLFMAGIVPGLFTAAVYTASIIYRASTNPRIMPRAVNLPTYSFAEKLRYSVRIWPIIVLIFIVLGGIYSGVFTPTEAAAVGALLTLLIGVWKGELKQFSVIREALKDSAKTTSMIFAIMVGALYFGRVLGVTRLPSNLTQAIIQMDVSPMMVTILILIILFFLGMFMNASAFFMFSFPIFFPVIVKLGINPVWFCIVAMKMAEIGAVTPPVGLNAFALKGVAGKDVSVEDVFSGVLPFIIADLVVLVFLFIFPQIATWLPDLYMGG